MWVIVPTDNNPLAQSPTWSLPLTTFITLIITVWVTAVALNTYEFETMKPTGFARNEYIKYRCIEIIGQVLPYIYYLCQRGYVFIGICLLALLHKN